MSRKQPKMKRDSLECRQKNADESRARWADSEYKRRVSQAISDGWKRRREERERLEALKPKPEPYHVPDLDGEEWRPIEGFEGCYAVSNMGRIKSLDRILPHKEHGTWHIKEKLLRQHKSGSGKHLYLSVMLHVGEGKMVCCKVHRAVAEAFIPRVPGKGAVNHIDGNKQNNRVDNIEWCTDKENTDHAWRTGLCENIVKAKSRSVRNIDTGEIFRSIAEAERACHVASGAIHHAVRKRGTSCGCRWEYVDTIRK